MIKRFAVLVSLLVGFAGLLAVPVEAEVEEEPVDMAEQEQAAEMVMEQLEAADEPIPMEEIEALEDLGPAPWLSFMPERSDEVVEAWTEVAEQLPDSAMGARHKPRGDRGPITFTESEEADEVGGNDTPDTGDRIRRFGTRNRQSRVVTIEGNLSGAPDRLPVEVECPSVEDDGSIPTANDPGPNVGFGALCGGEIGDGPHGESSGDTDFYAFGEAGPGNLLVLDVIHFAEPLVPIETTLGIYDADGNLVASGNDDGDLGSGQFLLFEPTVAGQYYGVVTGAGELQRDPFDSSSGAGVTETGGYQMFVVNLPPPCFSTEDDGAIGLANVPGLPIELCSGVIGDGPHGETTGDTDFYAVNDVEAGQLVIGDVVNLDGDPNFLPASVLGLYDEAGNLLASVEDSGDPEAPEFIEFEAPAAGNYFIGLAGGSELQSDPNDPASGAGVADTGPYLLGVGKFDPPPPPCLSVEDDGAIPLAVDTAPFGTGDDVLFVANCVGVVGDGPQASTGDVDFYSTRPMASGKILVVDFFDPDPASTAGDFTIGVYDSAGTLVAEGKDSPNPENLEFFQYEVEADGVYHVVIGGGLPADPNDSSSGTNTDITGGYDVFLVDTTQEVIDDIVGDGAAWRSGVAPEWPAPEAASADDARAMLDARIAEVTDEETGGEEPPPVDTDVFLVRLRAGDAISGGFDAARVTGIIDPAGVGRHASPFNPSFIYPADSPLRHERRVGFDHVATVTGIHAVFVTEGNGPYQGELRVTRSGLADERTRGQQTIFLDFDGAAVSPSIFGGPSGAPPVPPQDLSPLAAFLPAWGLEAGDEDAVIDATIDAVIENVDTDLRVLDGRNGDRDVSGKRREFDIEILNSRDHGERWGDPNVSRIVIGGTIDELQIPTIGIAQSIDPGNQETEETGVVLLDLLSAPAPDPISLNTYEVAPGFTRTDLIGHAVGHIAAHEVGHYIGNWHTETFNPQVSLMDAGGEFLSIFGVGQDGIFGTADDIDADFAEDVFNSFEGFVGLEDTAGRSVFALSSGNRKPRRPPSNQAVIGDMVTSGDGTPEPGVAIDLYSATEAGERDSYLHTTHSDSNGGYAFKVDAGCYTVVFIAPDERTFVGGGGFDERSLCIRAGETVDDVDARLNVSDPSLQTRIGDQVTFENGDPAVGVVVDLFDAKADGSRGRFIGGTTTDADGTYGFDVGSGCYVVVFTAPTGTTFVGGSPWSEQLVCLAEGETVDDVDAVLAGKPV